MVNILLFVTHASPKIVKQIIMTVLAKYTAIPDGFVRQLYHLVYKWGMGKKVVWTRVTLIYVGFRMCKSYLDQSSINSMYL